MMAARTTPRAALGLCALALAYPACAQAGSTWTLDWTLEVRERAEFLDNPAFTPGSASNPGDNRWVGLQRLQADGQVGLAPGVAVAASLVCAVRTDGPGAPVDTNALDFGELYLNLGDRPGDGDRWLRIGRQHLRYGSQRLVGWRDGTNVRRSFDGVRASLPLGEEWSVESFAALLVDIESTGVFNDGRDEGQVLAGVYGTGGFGPTGADVYYLYAERDANLAVEGTADQRRHTLGTRLFSPDGKDGLFWDWEAAVQFGRHGGADIRAWTLATNTGWRWADATWAPEVMLSANIASGDGRVGDGTLGTFDALFPRGSYFSEAAILGPSNFVNINPWLRVRPTERFSAFVNVNAFHRLRRADGVYGPPGNLLRAPVPDAPREVTTQVSTGLAYTLSDAVALEALYTFADAGRFIEAAGPSGDVNFVQLTLSATF